jgi:hypothetical protein
MLIGSWSVTDLEKDLLTTEHAQMELFIQTTIVSSPINCQLFSDSSHVWNYCEIYTMGGSRLSEGSIFMLNRFLKFYIRGYTRLV